MQRRASRSTTSCRSAADAQPGQAPGFCEQKSLKPPEFVVLVVVEVPPEPVPPVAAPVLVPPELVPPVAAPLLGAAGVTAAAPVPLLEDVEDEPLGVVEEGVLLEAASAVVDVPSVEAAAAPPIDVLAGATSACGFLGTTSCVALLPPQADTPAVAKNIRVTAVARRRMRGS
jgi:hypothetical protein